MKLLFTAREAANYVGYSVHALQFWRSHGRGPRYLKMDGRSVRYPKIELDLWIKESGRPSPLKRKRLTPEGVAYLAELGID